MLAGQAIGTSWVPDSHSFSRTHQRPARSRVDRGLDWVFGTRDPVYIEHVLSVIDGAHSDTLLAYWGTLPLSDITAIKRRRPSLRVVAVLLCYPLSTEPLGILRQKLAMRRAAPYLDGVVCPTTEMAAYLGAHVFDREAPHIGVVRPCWPLAYQPAKRAAVADERPNLIYVGRTDLSSSTAHKADDIRPLMREILDAGIELHHVFSPETADGHPRRNLFPPARATELIEMMTGFDASLIAYNLDACKRADRFDLTVPDRLLSTVAAGVPIAIPRTGYAASRTYLRDYEAVVPFDTPSELMDCLSDRTKMHELRDIAWQSRSRYSAEAQSQSLADVLSEISAS